MKTTKTAVAMPEGLLADVDRAAREHGESRSKFITRVLRAAVRARRDADITRHLNAMFANDAPAADQRNGARALGAVSPDWADERW